MPDYSHKIPVGISSCLLGQTVRYDGGHKYDVYINRRLADFFDFRPFCPEVAIGLGTPRPPIRLVTTSDGLRVRGVKDPSRDVTEQLCDYGNRVAAKQAELCGYIFKSRSPSCRKEMILLPGRWIGRSGICSWT